MADPDIYINTRKCLFYFKCDKKKMKAKKEEEEEEEKKWRKREEEKSDLKSDRDGNEGTYLMFLIQWMDLRDWERSFASFQCIIVMTERERENIGSGKSEGRKKRTQKWENLCFWKEMQIYD